MRVIKTRTRQPDEIADRVEHMSRRIRALRFRLIDPNRTDEEYTEIRKWLAAGKPDEWPVA